MREGTVAVVLWMAWDGWHMRETAAWCSTVMSSASYLTLEGQKYRSVEVSWNQLQLIRCAYLQSHPGEDSSHGVNKRGTAGYRYGVMNE